MFGKVTGLAGLICFSAIMIVGCRGVPSSAAPDLETASARTSTSETLSTSTVETTPVTPATQPLTTNLKAPQPEGQLDEREYTWNQLLARDAILPIYESEFVSAEDAPYDDDELVIGVELNGDARAYAIGPLNSREMVNDTVGGAPILVTW